ncbi:hypothetical protein [Micromonospora sp. URMC 103]|uniref:hypothetical protein n=1 Tax=Micromonospora sp. URMC 103 TaxID=3423406 RepID=UPI003F1DB762
MISGIARGPHPPADAEQRADLAAGLSPLRPLQRRGGTVVHPWPHPLPASWSGQLDRLEPLRYVQVEPTAVVEIDADVAFEHQRWRHQVRFTRTRPDMSIYDVPLVLGEEEGYYGEV